ncbi:predicted protein [Naegleria gruberi]|uniref:Predicted protein n=1 Tax=Naegleria gruberi TaxID=5762 RepID=D2V9M6_NAEGR|nr:uncharacterized protein NAEGRDRAFT_65493 [Naegleria gruberi]EFC46492.1 predicted protein [Naegleria gruberi]|eukprot:XP_002679236.1 predicted protein [Naegleria gruberi strain NEG-M]
MKRSLISSTYLEGVSSAVLLLLVSFTCCLFATTLNAAVLPNRQYKVDAQGSRRAPFSATHNDYAQPITPVVSTFEYTPMAMIYHSGWNRFLLGTLKLEPHPGFATETFFSGMITVDALTGKVANGGFQLEKGYSLSAPVLLSTKGYLYVPLCFKYCFVSIVNTLDWSLSWSNVESHATSVLVESVKCYIYLQQKSMKCLDMDNLATVKWTITIPEYSYSTGSLLLVNENNEEIVYYNGVKSISKVSPKQAKILTTVEPGYVQSIAHTGLSSFVVAIVKTQDGLDAFGIVHVDSGKSSFSNGIGTLTTYLYPSVTCIENPQPNTYIFKSLAYLTVPVNGSPTKILYHFSTTVTIAKDGVVSIATPQLFKLNELKSKTVSFASVSKDNCQVVLYRNGMYSKLDLHSGTFMMNVGSVTKGESFNDLMLGADNGRVYTIVGNAKTYLESIILN